MPLASPVIRGLARSVEKQGWNLTLPTAAPRSAPATPTPVCGAGAPGSAATTPTPVCAATTPAPVLHLIDWVDDGCSIINHRTVCRRGRSAGCTSHTYTCGNKHCNQDGSHSSSPSYVRALFGAATLATTMSESCADTRDVQFRSEANWERRGSFLCTRLVKPLDR